MPIKSVTDVTALARDAYATAADPRLAHLVGALVTHLHAFVTETALTEEELEFALDFLNRVGQATNDTHNEAALLADALGVSTLVCLRNNGMGAATEPAAALLGPFWRLNAPQLPNGASIIRSDTPGTPLEFTGEVLGTDGVPVAGARVDVWQASPTGLYENQDSTQADMNLRGTFTTDTQGRFRFRSVRPLGYPVPTDGPTGDLLAAFGRQEIRPAHVHVLIYKPGFKTLISQVYPSDDPHLEDDPVFGVTEALIGRYSERDGICVIEQRFVLLPGEARLPTPPIK